ncbi:hypothetical protein TNIN_115131 [Trichonephila inaurata madagascariensis]|uniref:Uncharacterized protein n=1 Tax=Trichonephila inaurata madagascariensis TaxID=2747483 RepID=A0A8X6XLS8_9ARAC|nr:hypothetical protein TNIN_115131 [Trichonephila inaurata madagascariensis]
MLGRNLGSSVADRVAQSPQIHRVPLIIPQELIRFSLNDLEYQSSTTNTLGNERHPWRYWITPTRPLSLAATLSIFPNDERQLKKDKNKRHHK